MCPCESIHCAQEEASSPFPLSLALPVSMGTGEGETDSLQGVTVRGGVECHLCDCSGVGGGQMIKKN